MKFGKYPLEPYGWQGGLFGKNETTLASGLGSLVGLLIGATAILGFKLAEAAVKLIARSSVNAWNGMSASLREGIRNKE